jgi:hypothetical protein
MFYGATEMTDLNPTHAEVFVPANRTIEAGSYIVLPPRPDSSGRFDPLELGDWYVFMLETHRCFVKVCSLIESELGRPPKDGAQEVRECLFEIQKTLPLFLLTEPSLIPAQQCAKDRCAMLYVKAAVWANEVETVKSVAQFMTGSSDKFQSLSQALVENGLNGNRDWRQATSPAQWVKRVANRRAKKESRIQKYAVDPLGEPDTIRLEEIAEMPIEAVVEPKYSMLSIAELEAAAREDPDLAEYFACKARRPSWSCELIALHLGWEDKRAKRVDRRLRRMKRALAARGAGIQCREHRPRAGISDASFTVYREPLFEGTRGLGASVWQHRTPDKS